MGMIIQVRYLKAVSAASGAWEGILGSVLKGSPVYLEWALPRADAWKNMGIHSTFSFRLSDEDFCQWKQVEKYDEICSEP